MEVDHCLWNIFSTKWPLWPHLYFTGGSHPAPSLSTQIMYYWGGCLQLVTERNLHQLGVKDNDWCNFRHGISFPAQNLVQFAASNIPWICWNFSDNELQQLLRVMIRMLSFPIWRFANSLRISDNPLTPLSGPRRLQLIRHWRTLACALRFLISFQQMETYNLLDNLTNENLLVNWK